MYDAIYMTSVFCYPVIQLSQHKVFIYMFLYLETFEIPPNPPLLRGVRNKKPWYATVRMQWGLDVVNPP